MAAFSAQRTLVHVAANVGFEPEADLHIQRASRPQHFRQTPRPSGRAAVQQQKRSFVLAAANLSDPMTALRTLLPLGFLVFSCVRFGSKFLVWHVWEN